MATNVRQKPRTAKTHRADVRLPIGLAERISRFADAEFVHRSDAIRILLERGLEAATRPQISIKDIQKNAFERMTARRGKRKYL